MNRRDFVKFGIASAGISAFPLFSIGSQQLPEAAQLKIGCIGTGTMMSHLLESFLTRSRVVAICDVDQTRRNATQLRVNEFYGSLDCEAYLDYRELLARDDIDAVLIATPDHWHATITIDAARAGKHIYCEKPLTHDIDESVRVLKAVKDAGVVLQTGSQQRSMKEFRIAAELVRNEVAGKVKRITSKFWGPGKPCSLGEEAMEPGLDWNRWCGPAPYHSYHSDLSPRGVHSHYPRWRAYRDYGGGGVCDMGAHHLDIIQWALNKDHSGPVAAVPGRKGAKLVYENGIEVTRTGNFHIDFECENGRIQVTRKKFRLELEGKTVHQYLDRNDLSLNRALAMTEEEFLSNAKIRLPVQQNGGHHQNFLDAITEGTQLIAPVEVGARSAICCHLMNLTYYHDKKLGWDPYRFEFTSGGKDAWLTGSRRDYLNA